MGLVHEIIQSLLLRIVHDCVDVIVRHGAKRFYLCQLLLVREVQIFTILIVSS